MIQNLSHFLMKHVLDNGSTEASETSKLPMLCLLVLTWDQNPRRHTLDHTQYQQDSVRNIEYIIDVMIHFKKRNGNRISKDAFQTDVANLYSVLELETNCCANWLVVSQHCGGYDRRAQDGAQIPGYVHKVTHYNYEEQAMALNGRISKICWKTRKKKKTS